MPMLSDDLRQQLPAMRLDAGDAVAEELPQQLHGLVAQERRDRDADAASAVRMVTVADDAD